MTYREKLTIEHPECIYPDGRLGGCRGCPSDYGYMIPANGVCFKNPNKIPKCTECWDQEFIEEKGETKMEDYKIRVVKEYVELKEKYEKLHKMIVKYDAGTLDFEPNCPIDLLREQKATMGKYLNILEIRAEIEGIDLGYFNRCISVGD